MRLVQNLNSRYWPSPHTGMKIETIGVALN
uniref:Uncharacterized protein n=1 Tax=Arundo donax TaxID=35708 RepID=A0A0A8XR81_ARUDO